MMRCFLLFVIVITLASCGEPQQKPKDVIGVWQNVAIWDNNRITLTVRDDSTMLFKAEKSFCPGTKFFVAIGQWHIDHDTLVMKPITDGRKFEIDDLFPELIQMRVDSSNVFALDIEAKLIIADSSLYDLSPEHKPNTEHRYHRISK
jgi:hypothetical protein